MVIAVKFTLYEVVEKPKLRLKLIEEIIAWQVYSHQKMLITSDAHKRTEIMMANQQKEWGIVHSVILWKTKQIKEVQGYLQMSRVYDMVLVPQKKPWSDAHGTKSCIVLHSCNRGPLEFAEIDL